MRIQYKSTGRSVKASARPNRTRMSNRTRMPSNARRPIKAEEEMIDDSEIMDQDTSELLFEATDVADLLAEITGEDVDMDMDDDVVVFTIGEDEYTIEPEGDEEVLESVRRPMRRMRPVKAGRRPSRTAQRKPAARPSVRRK